MSATPGSGTVDLTAKGVYSATVTLTPATSLAQVNVVVDHWASSGGHTVAEAYVLLTVVRSGGSLPTHSPIVLYAADKYDMATAEQVRRSLALPATNVTGTFKQAWKDTAAGKDLARHRGRRARRRRALLQRLRVDRSGGLARRFDPVLLPGLPDTELDRPQLLRAGQHADHGRHHQAAHRADPVRADRVAARLRAHRHRGHPARPPLRRISQDPGSLTAERPYGGAPSDGAGLDILGT